MSWLDRLLPGDRRVWWAAGIAVGAGLVVIAVALILPRDYYTGTNSVRSRGYPTALPPGAVMCVRGLDIPAGTARVQLDVWNNGQPLPALDGWAEIGGRRSASTHVAATAAGDSRKVSFTIPTRPDSSESTRGEFCVRAAGNVAFGGVAGLRPNDAAPTVNGRPAPNRVGVWFLPSPGEKRSALAQLPTIAERAALFRPGVVGPWTYWVLLFAWAPLVAYAALRLLATAGEERRTPRVTAIALAAVAVGNAAAWALITPPFDSPDESEHFAYVQWFAETGQRVARDPNPDRPTYSTQEQLTLDALRVSAYSETPDGRPRWLAADERRLNHRLAVAGRDPPRDDGGGNAIATQLNDPLYYSTLAPAYLAASGSSPFTQLTATRLLSTLFGAVVALCAFAVVRELLPRHPFAAVAAGLLVAFQPMFAFISGSVNNDNGVNAMAAIVIWLCVRGLRRGLGTGTAVALGLAVIALPVMKPTGYALYPLVVLALAGMAWRRHSRDDLRVYAALAASVVAALLAWKLTAPLFDQPAPQVKLPSNDVEITSVPGRHDIPGYLSYLWQVFLPPLPSMDDHFLPRLPFYDIYVVRGFGAFGWYQVLFPDWVYRVILLVLIGVAASGALTLRRHRTWARRHWMELAFIALVPVVVLAAIEAAFYTPGVREVTAEFGRYGFPAIAAMAVLAVGACFAWGRRQAPFAAAALVGAMIVLNLASQVLTLVGSYT